MTVGCSVAVAQPVVVVLMGFVQASRADLTGELMVLVACRRLCLIELQDPWATPVHWHSLATMAVEPLLVHSISTSPAKPGTGFVNSALSVNLSKNQGWRFVLVSLRDIPVGPALKPPGSGQQPSLEG